MATVLVLTQRLNAALRPIAPNAAPRCSAETNCGDSNGARCVLAGPGPNAAPRRSAETNCSDSDGAGRALVLTQRLDEC